MNKIASFASIALLCAISYTIGYSHCKVTSAMQINELRATIGSLLAKQERLNGLLEKLRCKCSKEDQNNDAWLDIIDGDADSI